MLVVALDTNGDYHIDGSTTHNLRTDFALRSAAASGQPEQSTAGREFVIVSSSGYFNESDPNDPNNEPSPGVILLVRDPTTGGFDNSRTRTSWLQVGDNQSLQRKRAGPAAQQRAADCRFPFRRIAHCARHRQRRHARTRYRPRLTTPISFSDDAPLDVAVNSRGVVFSHSAGNDMVMLALYDDNGRRRSLIAMKFAWKVSPSTTTFFFTV